MGEPLPKQVAKQWQQWCNGQGYVETAFKRDIHTHFYDDITLPSKWLLATDDDIANLKNVEDMVRVFPNASAQIEILHPDDFKVKEIGHMKFFSRKCQHIWPQASHYLAQFIDT